MVQPCIWFKEEASQFSMGQTAPYFIMEKPHTGLDECPRILLSCFRARNSGGRNERDPQDEWGSRNENPNWMAAAKRATCNKNEMQGNVICIAFMGREFEVSKAEHLRGSCNATLFSDQQTSTIWGVRSLARF